MEFEVKKAKKLEDGQHEGIITSVKYRDVPHKYTELVIESEDTVIVHSVATPENLTETTHLGKLMSAFGQVLDVGILVEPEKVFIGKHCMFLTMKNENGYAQTVKDSLRWVQK